MTTTIVALTSDFGTDDPYVGEMKARILELAPRARVVDLSHAVPPGSIRAGAYLLGRAQRVFPAGAIHVAVVDPGVGGTRPAVAMRVSGQYFVGPDNGLFARICPGGKVDEAVRLIPAELIGTGPTSATFHGRDLFAPAAAQLANGRPLGQLGEPITHVMTIDPSVRFEPDLIVAEVVWIDHYGNLITELLAQELGADPQFEIKGHRIDGLRRTFCDVSAGAALAYAGSGGTLELALRDGSLAARWGIELGEPIFVRTRRGPTP